MDRNEGQVLRRIDRSLAEQQHTSGSIGGLDGALSWDPVDGNQMILLDNVDGVCTITLVDIDSGERVEAARWECGLGAAIAVRGWVALI